MSHERDHLIRGLRRQVDLERKTRLRRPFVQSRRDEADTDLMQLSLASVHRLRITAEGNGAEEEDIGKFWFVLGYSVLDGPDVMAEE